MRITRLKIDNFRGIQTANILLPSHAVLIGDNNVGKTTLLEAIDLVLGPDRLNRNPPIDEHDFYQGKYTAAGTGATDDAVDSAEPPPDAEGESSDSDVDTQAYQQEDPDAPKIEIEVTIVDLTEEQKERFGDYIEFWDRATDDFYELPDPAGVDADTITEALRVTFHGWYDAEEDDFEGKTYFSRSLLEEPSPTFFSKKDKQVCGFLYLRSLRTGSRALSLERGSLLDIILRLKEVRPRMWEATLNNLTQYDVAAEPELGISGVLESINDALNKYVPKEWGVEPHLKVSNLTREHLRKVVTAFMATGEGDHAAPYFRQGTGTINMLVLAMLSLIAQDRQNVIFAMEEPETAIPPYAQKRIVHEVRKLASQTIFTSHSPYVLEEFSLNETVVLARNDKGALSQSPITLPDSVKPKRYRQEFRSRFCEGLLARRVLIAEGATEAAAFPVACRRLAELNPNTYISLEALGICTIDGGSETQIADLAELYSSLGKQVFSICDKQDDANKRRIEARVDILLMHEEKGFEDLVLKNTTQAALDRFVKLVEWPPYLQAEFPDPEANAKQALRAFFDQRKGDAGVADFLVQCTEAEIPEWVRKACIRLKEVCITPMSVNDTTVDPDESTEA